MLELWVRQNLIKTQLSTATSASSFNLKVFNVKKEKVNLKQHGLKSFLLWNPITCGSCYTYRAYDRNSNVIIHESYVIHKCYKFPFLGKNDIEIGPCYTHENWRGKGIYPAVLNMINEEELTNFDKSYMIIDSSNTASIRGVIKAGYSKVSQIKKSKFLKIYTPISNT